MECTEALPTLGVKYSWISPLKLALLPVNPHWKPWEFFPNGPSPPDSRFPTPHPMEFPGAAHGSAPERGERRLFLAGAAAPLARGNQTMKSLDTEHSRSEAAEPRRGEALKAWKRRSLPPDVPEP